MLAEELREAAEGLGHPGLKLQRQPVSRQVLRSEF